MSRAGSHMIEVLEGKQEGRVKDNSQVSRLSVWMNGSITCWEHKFVGGAAKLYLALSRMKFPSDVQV